MKLNIKQGLIAFLLGAAAGIFLFPKPEPEVKIQEVIKTEVQRDIKIVEKEVKPDGTVITRKTVDLSNESSDTKRDTTVNPPKRHAAGVLYGLDKSLTLSYDHRLMGNVFVSGQLNIDPTNPLKAPKPSIGIKVEF